MTGSLAGPRRHAVVHGEVTQFGPGLQCRRAVAPGTVQPAAAQGGPRQLRGRQQQTEEQQCPGGVQHGQPPADRVRRGVSARERQRRRCGQRRGVGADARQEAVVVFVRAGAAGRLGIRGIGRHHTARRGRFERHPAQSLEIQFRPGMGVTRIHLVLRQGTLAPDRNRGAGCPSRGIADGDPAGDAFQPGHHRHGRREMDAVSALLVQEVRQHGQSVAVIAALHRGLQRIGEIRPSAGNAGWPGPGRREWSFPQSRPRLSAARSPGRWRASG